MYDIQTTQDLVSVLELFFYKAEDGIRYADVTGVQTCALPISRRALSCAARRRPGLERLRRDLAIGAGRRRAAHDRARRACVLVTVGPDSPHRPARRGGRSEERRGGEEGRTRGSPCH